MAEENDIASQLAALADGYGAAMKQTQTEQEARDLRARYVAKDSAFAGLQKQLGKVPPAEKPALGQRFNAMKQTFETELTAQLSLLHKRARQADLDAPPFDLTLPPRLPVADGGHRHPISRVREDVVNVFRQLGFAVFDGPEVELEDNNFGLLGYPPDHPATDMQDTFWTDVRVTGAAKNLLLRSHTSNIQIRAMKALKPPMAFIAPGTVYRRDDDATHSPMFHQIEAFLIDKNVTLAHLKGVLAEFAERIYGPNTPVRLRPAYFPFVEPGAEVDIGCVFCKQPDGTRAGCSLCKHTGWMEILGSGMIHPIVLENCGIDPEVWSGFALGMGIERIAMLKYGIPNIKHLFDNDPRFLAQF
jgi:phenylalanyl-tRNA synthetase alpha chain